ncbi:MAG: SGNH/GDSL hydrolase family protein [Microthrixaceae bacterium]
MNSPLARIAGVRRGLAHSRTSVGRYRAWWHDHNERTVGQVAERAAGGWWLALGDSAAQGVGAPHPSQGWAGQLAAAGGAADRLVNVSVSGAKARDLVDDQLPRAHALIDRLGRPEAVAVHIGANDLVRPGHPLRLHRGLAAIADWLVLQQLGPATVVGLMPTSGMGLSSAEANWRIRRTARSVGAGVADINRPAKGSLNSRLADDLFHPNALGYAAWAQGFAAAMGLPLPPVPDVAPAWGPALEPVGVSPR